VLVNLLGVIAAWSQVPGRVVPSPEPDWPQFRGPTRNGVCAGTGLLTSWPEAGPPLLWRVSGLGRGYSSPIIANGTLYVTGDAESLTISALGLDSQRQWTASNGRPWTGPFPGARASCTFAGGRLYHLNANGRVACLDPAAGGKELWSVEVLERFHAPNIQWGLSECLLVDADRVLVTPGGPETLMVALDRNTGATVWQTEPLRFQRTHKMGGEALDPPQPDTDKAGYASPVLFELDGRRLVAGASARHAFLVDATAGKLLWTEPVFARYEVIGAMPAFWHDSVFFCSPDEFGGRLFRIVTTPETCRGEARWENPSDNCHGALIAVGDRLYGSGYRRYRPWACIDLPTGRTLYEKADLGIGSGVYADGHLYALAQDGTVALLKPTPAGFEEAGRFRLVTQPVQDVWAHPVIHGGRLYLRYHDTLWCYDLRRP
jgi:outer membrane protein assembly factor BamB